MSRSTQIVTAVLTSKPKTTPIALVKRGVANEKVVAQNWTVYYWAYWLVWCVATPNIRK